MRGQLELLACCVALAALWLGVYTLITGHSVDWWLRLPEFGGGMYIVIGILLNRMKS